MTMEYKKPEALLILFAPAQQLAAADAGEQTLTPHDGTVDITSMPQVDEGFEPW